MIHFKITHAETISRGNNIKKIKVILKVGRKWKGWAGDNYKRTVNIKFEQDWSVGLGAMIDDG